MQAIHLLGINESAKTTLLRAHLTEALLKLGLNIPIKEISEIDALIQYDIHGIAALVLNNHVLCERRVPEVDELVNTLQASLSLKNIE